MRPPPPTRSAPGTRRWRDDLPLRRARRAARGLGRRTGVRAVFTGRRCCRHWWRCSCRWPGWISPRCGAAAGDRSGSARAGLGRSRRVEVLALPDAPWSAAARPILDGALQAGGTPLSRPSRPAGRRAAGLRAHSRCSRPYRPGVAAAGLRAARDVDPECRGGRVGQMFRPRPGCRPWRWRSATRRGGGGAGRGPSVVRSAAVDREGARRPRRAGCPVVAVAALGVGPRRRRPAPRARLLRARPVRAHRRPGGPVSPLAEIGGSAERPTIWSSPRKPTRRWTAGPRSSSTARRCRMDSERHLPASGAAFDPDPDVKVAKGLHCGDHAGRGRERAVAADAVPHAVGRRSAARGRPGDRHAARRRRGAATYSLRWQAPQPTKDDLVGRPSTKPRGVRSGRRPARGLVDLPRGARECPSVVRGGAEAGELVKGQKTTPAATSPTGSGDAQVLDFLTSPHSAAPASSSPRPTCDGPGRGHPGPARGGVPAAETRLGRLCRTRRRRVRVA